MTKIVYNACHGGFGLSEAAIRRYAFLKGLTLYPEYGRFSAVSGPTWWTVPPEGRSEVLSADQWNDATPEQRRASNEAYSKQRLTDRDIERDDPLLVQIVEELGSGASGEYADLRIAVVQSGMSYRIDEYDGRESVMTINDYDWKVAKDRG